LRTNHRALLSRLLFCCTVANAQTITFELQTHPDSPLAVITYASSTIRTPSDRRQFLTVKNESANITVAMLFQQAVSSGSKTEILSLERVSIIMRPHEKKRLSVSVADVWDRIQTTAQSARTTGKPVLSVVAVEFIDGSIWSAPSDRAPK
jgi:hypothetical protein